MQILRLTFISRHSNPMKVAVANMSNPEKPLNMKIMNMMMVRDIFMSEEYEIRDIFFATIFPMKRVV